MSANSTTPRFASFREFYPYYLSAHANRTSRRLHFVGTSLVVVLLLAALWTGRGILLLAAPVAGYSLAWLGHYAFERNRPATFRHPIYSLAGDFVMARDILIGRIRW